MTLPYSFLTNTLRTTLLHWYKGHGRQLPWRFSNPEEHAANVYAIWVSEIMLQQTQVQTVIPYFDRWLTKFPDLLTLAQADQQIVLKQWQGLGYYARARNLHRAAQIIVAQHHSHFPQVFDEVLALPGIGRSTAGGILSSAFNLPYAILDGNVKRVLARLIALPHPPVQALSKLWQCSEQLLDAQQPREFNQALMDLGATLCLPKSPICSHCPWQQQCQAYQLGLQTKIPQRQIKAPIPHKFFGVALIQNSQGEVLIDRRYQSGLLGGLWEFPNIEVSNLKTLPEQLGAGITDAFGIQISIDDQLCSINHAYTHFRAALMVHRCHYLTGEPQAHKCAEAQWVAITDLEKFPFSKAHQQIIEHLNHNIKT